MYYEHQGMEVLMNDIIREIEKEQMKENLPQFRTGDTVAVSAKIREGDRVRTQVFEGTVIKIQGTGARTTFTVRKISNGVGVEKSWPLHSPNVESVKVIREGKARRAKLYYLRERTGKAAKVKAAQQS
jgi:large subunit ribosomal protein L19